MRHHFAWILVTAAMYGELGNAAPRAKPGASSVIEAAPLRGMMGQIAVRGEVPVKKEWPLFAVGAAFDQLTRPSERADMSDRMSSLAVEALLYPLGTDESPLFVALGTRFEQAEIGRQRERDAQTWIQQRSTERLDLWVDQDSYVSATQSLGYRAFLLERLTGSLRITRDELLMMKSSARADNVRPGSEPLEAKGRPRVRHSIAVHVGFKVSP